VIIDRNTSLEAYELKFKKNLDSDDLRGLKAFESEYTANLHLVNLDIQEGKS
jgi:hypothetical protein